MQGGWLDYWDLLGSITYYADIFIGEAGGRGGRCLWPTGWCQHGCCLWPASVRARGAPLPLTVHWLLITRRLLPSAAAASGASY